MADEKSGDYRVVFAVDSRTHTDTDPGTIIIFPSDDGWNDFGFRIRAGFLIHTPLEPASSPRVLHLEGFLGFLTPEVRLADTRSVRQTLSETGEAHAPLSKFPEFFTMLPEMSAYRRIVDELGSREANLVLRALHDMVEADLGGARSWLQRARDSEVFQNAFLRTTESYFTWKNAGSILQGLEFEQVGKISEMLSIRFQLAGRPNAHEMQFTFALDEPVLPKRFAIVIGENGVGKSQTLGRIVRSALKGTTDLTDGDGNRPSFNRILAFSPTIVSSSVFPNESGRNGRVWYRHFSLSGQDARRRKQLTSDLIVQLARTAERIRGSRRFEIFLNALRKIEGHPELALPRRRGMQGAVFIEDLLTGSEQEVLARIASLDLKQEPVRFVGDQLYHLSSGEQNFLRFAVLASLYIENSTLLLFDEPETHLHPRFISQFVALLDDLLENTGSAAIIATHSVYFVREAFEDQVRVLRSNTERQISVEIPNLRTFGADVGAISYFVFGEDQPSRLAKAVEQRIADASDSWEGVFEKYKDDLSLELLGEIRSHLDDREASAS